MASDSGISNTESQSEDLDNFTDPRSHQRYNTISMLEILSTSTRKKMPLKGDMRGIVKRAQSSPNVRDLAHIDISGMSNADKKRNKLGYHRTAVACVHCRRRKIRCILAMDDPASRCHNCIRLKKECMFYPVDQQPGLGKRSKSSSKLDEDANDDSTPEPSPPLVETSWENIEDYSPNQYQSSYAHAPDGTAAFSFANSILPPEVQGMPSLPYRAPALQHMSWNSAPLLSPTHTFDVGGDQFDSLEQQHWQQRMHPASAGFEYPQYTTASMPATMVANPADNFQQYGQMHVGQAQGWHYSQGPVRSMSLATPGEMQQFHTSFYNDHGVMHQRQSTNGSDINPPSLIGNTHPTPPSSDTQSTPGAFSYTDLPQLNSSFQNPNPGWTTLAPVQSPAMATSGAEGFPQHNQMWYNVPPGLAKVNEEEELASLHQHGLAPPQIRVIPHYGPKPG